MSPERRYSQEIAVKDFIPYEFMVENNSGRGEEVASGIAVTKEDLHQRRAIVADRYLKAKYIEQEDLLSNGEYFDEYEQISIPIVAKIDNRVAASMRVIPNIPDKGLPINSEDEIEIFPEWKEKITEIPFEISQLAKSMHFYHDPRPTFALIRSYFAYSRLANESEAAGVVDNRVKNVLNGQYMSFGLPDVGPSTEYMGSKSTPIYINIDDVIKNTAEGGHTELAEFLDTGKAPGFEWYRGM